MCFKYSCLIQIIFKQIYLIQRWNPDTTISGQSGPEINGKEEVTLNSSELQDWSLTTICNLVSYPGHWLQAGPMEISYSFHTSSHSLPYHFQSLLSIHIFI